MTTARPIQRISLPSRPSLPSSVPLALSARPNLLSTPTPSLPLSFLFIASQHLQSAARPFPNDISSLYITIPSVIYLVHRPTPSLPLSLLFIANQHLRSATRSFPPKPPSSTNTLPPPLLLRPRLAFAPLPRLFSPKPPFGTDTLLPPLPPLRRQSTFTPLPAPSSPNPLPTSMPSLPLSLQLVVGNPNDVQWAPSTRPPLPIKHRRRPSILPPSIAFSLSLNPGHPFRPLSPLSLGPFASSRILPFQGRQSFG